MRTRRRGRRLRTRGADRHGRGCRSKHTDVVRSTIRILSGIARLAVLVGHAPDGGRSRGDGSRSGTCRCGNADGVLTDCRVAVSAGAVSVGAASERNSGGRWSRSRSDTDVMGTSPAGAAVSTVRVGCASESGVGGVADGGSRSKSSERYESKGGDGCVVHLK